jgi:hypothetical protein
MASGLHCETPDSCGEGKRERGGGRWEEHDEAGGRCWKEKGVTAVCD